jgi:hypothetical protein
MRKNFIISLFIIVNTISSSFASSESDEDFVYSNEIKKTSIHTVQMHPIGWELAAPIIKLKGDNKLLFSFDEITENIQDYSYRIIHCNKNWQTSNLSEFDFLEGFSENQIQDYEHSFNTNVHYIHYKLQIPNNDIQLKISGNYILEVYEDFNPDKVVLRQRFMLLDSKVEIKGKIKHPTAIEIRESHQELDFSIFHPSFNIDNPHMDLHVVATQNNRWDGSQKNLKPLFIRKNELVFDYEMENIFPGGNEFRHFDLKSMRYQTRFIHHIDRTDERTDVYLTRGNNRRFKPYIYEKDIDGQFLIDVQEYDNATTEADYAYIHFTLPFESELKHGDVFVHGKFNNWEMNNRNKMEYNYDKGVYEKTIFLKQGYYNYIYTLRNKKNKTPDLGYFEGNHWQTENIYHIYVYYHDISMNYDMLIGYKALKSTVDFYK